MEHAEQQEDRLIFTDSAGNEIPDPGDSKVSSLDDARDKKKAYKDAKKALRDAAKEAGEEKERAPTPEELWKRKLESDKDMAYTRDLVGNIRPMTWNGWTWVEADDIELGVKIHAFLESVGPGWMSNRAIKNCLETTPISLVNSRARELKLDPDRNLICTRNAVIEILKNGELVWHEPGKQYYSRIAVDVSLPSSMLDGPYVRLKETEDLESGLFGKLITDMLPEARARAEFQEFFGDTLTPTMRKVMTMLVGDQDTGKSQVLRLACAMHSKYVAGDFSSMEGFDISHYPGNSLVIYDEVPSRLGVVGEKIFKGLVGGAPMQIKRKYKDAITADPDWKTMCGANRMMEFSEKTRAIQTRMRVFKCHSATGAMVPNIADKILRGYTSTEGHVKSQLLDVLQWALHGARRVVMRGDVLKNAQLNEESRALSAEIVDQSNPCIRWLEEHEVEMTGEHTWISKEELHRLFVDWCLGEGLTGHARVSRATFFRDYFTRSMKDMLGPTVDMKERKLSDDSGKRVMCVPVRFNNMPEARYINHRHVVALEAQEMKEKASEKDKLMTPEQHSQAPLDQHEPGMRESDSEWGGMTYEVRETDNGIHAARKYGLGDILGE